MKRIIRTAEAPAALGPYSQAVLINGTLYISCQLAIDPTCGKFCGGSIAEQTDRIMGNIQNILQEAGFAMSDVVKVSVFLSDMKMFGDFNEAYKKYFQKAAPARTCIGANELPLGALVGIDVTAAK